MSEESELFMMKIPKVMQQWTHPALPFPSRELWNMEIHSWKQSK